MTSSRPALVAPAIVDGWSRGPSGLPSSGRLWAALAVALTAPAGMVGGRAAMRSVDALFQRAPLVRRMQRDVSCVRGSSTIRTQGW
jgi:hypothetical protein